MCVLRGLKSPDPEQMENHLLLGCEQAEQIDTDLVYKRVKAEMDKRMNTLKLYERKVIKATNTRVVPVANYVMTVCDFNQKQIDDFGKLIEKALRDKRMHGRQASDEWVYSKVEEG